MTAEPRRDAHPDSSAEVVLDRVTRRYTADRGARAGSAPPPAAVDAVSLTVRRGEIVMLIGPSGCGKSTTLRMIAGLDDPDGGTITINGRAMNGVAPQDRDVAMVFQGYALYPQMTARQIMEFPLKMRKVPPAERARAVDEAASMLGLTKLLDRRPDQLSGGERQRVAMGRAIVRKPRVFLFDEPLSNIDPSLREDIRLEIGTLVRRLGATALYVTHDHAEAMTLGDRLAVLRAGQLLQCASPRDVYERPAREFVGTFVGAPRMNLLDATLEDDTIVAGPFRVPRPAGVTLPRKLRVGVRPEHVLLDHAPATNGAPDGAAFRGGSSAQGEVVAVEPLGAETHLVLRVGELTLRARRPGLDAPARGASVPVALDASGVHLFDPAQDGARVGP